MDNQKSKIKKKPKFKRQNFLLKKLKNSWRRPRGLHSKLRLKRRGKGKRPKIGYGNYSKLRGLIKNQSYAYIRNVNDLENIKKPIIISSKTGLRKKLEIAKKAEELKLNIINVDVKKLLEKLKERKDKKVEKKQEKKVEEKKPETTKEEKERKLKEEKKKVLEKGL